MFDKAAGSLADMATDDDEGSLTESMDFDLYQVVWVADLTHFNPPNCILTPGLSPSPIHTFAVAVQSCSQSHLYPPLQTFQDHLGL